MASTICVSVHVRWHGVSGACAASAVFGPSRLEFSHRKGIETPKFEALAAGLSRLPSCYLKGGSVGSRKPEGFKEKFLQAAQLARESHVDEEEQANLHVSEQV